MQYTIVVSSAAFKDIEQAFDWYEQISFELGESIKRNLFTSMSELENNPYLSSIKYKTIRVKFISRFPYGIHYVVQENKVKILAFFHMKRDPVIWDEL
jgi:plasmid stabilization system protein ParE